MAPIAWMAGASLLSWLVISAYGGERVNPELFFGMLGPLVSSGLTWLAVDRVWRRAPEKLTGVMTAGFAAKMLFFGLYVALMPRALALRPVPFVVALVSYFIALYAMQAMFLKRLTAPR